MEASRIAFVFANVLIALAYVGIGSYVAPRFQVLHEEENDRKAWREYVQVPLIRLCAITFFVTCAMTHLELAYQSVAVRVGWHVTWHSLLIHGVQGPAGIGFLLLASHFLRVRITAAPKHVADPLDFHSAWKNVRDVLLFLGGLAGIGVLVIRREYPPELMILFSAMMGLGLGALRIMSGPKSP